MKCRRCKTRDATVHLTEVRPGGNPETHLCMACAVGRGLFDGLPDEVEFVCPWCGRSFEVPWFLKPPDRVNVACPGCGRTVSVILWQPVVGTRVVWRVRRRNAR